jgi:hypothetical protein
MAPASSAAASGLTLVRSDRDRDRERDAGAEPSDRRLHPRLTLSDLDWLNSVRLKYGPVVSLIDLSSGGAQIETSSPLNPGAIVVVQISSREGEIAMPSTVLRSEISRVAPYAMYRSALSFKRVFDAPPHAADKSSDAFANLIGEHARMTGAIRKLSHACSGGHPESLVGDEILTSTLALIQSPAGRRAGDSFRRHLTQLFRDLTRGIEAATPTQAMLSGLGERLRRSVPTRVIRIADATMPFEPHGPDTIYFDATREGSVTTRLLVEFPRDCQLEEWHLQFLRVAAQLVALVNEVSTLRDRAAREADAAAPPAAPEPGPAPLPFAALPPAPVPAGIVETPVPPSTVWIPVVARYADGRVLKGHCRGFLPARGYLSVAPAPDAPQAAVSTVMLRHLKAVFFVHDLAGAPADVEPTPAARGRDIIVTFMDGEVMSGTTLNYAVDGAGFYLSPHKQRGNNLRIFVINEAVRHVQFP